MPKAKVGDISIYYEIHGEGEPLVYVNGCGLSVEFTYRQIPVYSSEYRLILFDNRGAGQSDKPDVPYTTEIMAKTIIATKSIRTNMNNVMVLIGK